jgi:hypothetical protein
VCVITASVTAIAALERVQPARVQSAARPLRTLRREWNAEADRLSNEAIDLA